ncbi:type II toxin-antitoxin system death-on-curing family toxin [Actinotignum sp. GS-2025f]|uniref:type II toxin-antitoxin system death-on-curing family toxin n=1 Tax=Actinotignum TaxID=1653174 RepID=UPI002A816E0E|nr:type II toxin-antitoxin system death-on-curing family toxin [Actinotignum sp. SLA_B059]MDY5127948.1 type II toxin-antitoxin system death-on-curing family toxin [Actinotignum sp. SLA_B059]
MKYLSKRQILLIHQELLETSGGTSGLRDEGLLDSALMTPLQSFGGQDLYPSLIDKAVRLAFGLIKNHPFIDGNKRIGTHAMLVFLALNGVELSYTDDEMIAIILSVAAGQVDESGLRAWIDEHLP